MVKEKYASLGVAEIHIDEWGLPRPDMGPGTAMAIFHYLDLSGVHRAAPGIWSQGPLSGLLVKNTMIPSTQYWCWVEYAKQDGGLRLVTETNDRGVVALASRHNDGIVRALVARAKQRRTFSDRGKKLAPVRTTVDFEGLPFDGNAAVTTLKLGPYDGPMWEEDLESLTTRDVITVADGRLSLILDGVREQQVYSIRIAPPGMWERTPTGPAPTPRTEDFNGYAPTHDWVPAAADSWNMIRHIRESGARIVLSPKYGRDGSMGLAGVRKASSVNTAHWHAKLGREVDTLRCYVMTGGPGTGVEIKTQQAGAFAGYVRVGYRDMIYMTDQPARQAGVTMVPPDRFTAKRWYKIELQHDFRAHKQRARVDNGEWTEWIPMLSSEVKGISSGIFYDLGSGDNEISYAIDDLATYRMGTDGQ